MKKEKIKTRIAPSPTGNLHIGTARTALFNYLFAKKNNGKFLLRLEDTDNKRSTLKHEKNIIQNLEWLGLHWDEKPIRQMERLDIYKKYAQELLHKKQAYYCFCTTDELEKERKRQIAKKIPPRYSGKCLGLKENEIKERIKKGEKPTLRLKIPESRGKIQFTDLIRGKIQDYAPNIGDFIIVKSDGVPIFYFAGVIDDYKQEIGHVIRGEDHISNTFNQILIYEALGLKDKIPQYAHLPLILNKDRSKMSKRKGNIVTISDFRKKGYLKEALINFMALLGWHPKNANDKDKEILTQDQLIEPFKLKDIGKSASIFDLEKLDYINGYYLRNMDDEEILKLLIPDYIESDWEKNEKLLIRAVSLVKDRMKKLSDFKELANYFFKTPILNKNLLIFKKSDINSTQKGLEISTRVLENLPEKEWQDQDKIQKILEKTVLEQKLTNGDVFWPVRAALSGREASPSPSEILWALGKEEALKRLTAALGELK